MSSSTAINKAPEPTPTDGRLLLDRIHFRTAASR